jgi:hypothetical protein
MGKWDTLDYKVRDCVRHPRRPEWGKGEILSLVGTRAQIRFEAAGTKQIDLAIVQLEPWAEGLHSVVKSGEKHRFGLRVLAFPKFLESYVLPLSLQKAGSPVFASTPLPPWNANSANAEGPRPTLAGLWTCEEISSWRKFWKDGGLPRDWQAAWPQLITDEDLNRALEDRGGGRPGHYLPWLGVLLAWEQFKHPSLMFWSQGNQRKSREALTGFGPEREAKLQKILEKIMPSRLPALLLHRSDGSRCALLGIQSEKDWKDPANPALADALRCSRALELELHWIVVRPEKFVHILAGHTPA